MMFVRYPLDAGSLVIHCNIQLHKTMEFNQSTMNPSRILENRETATMRLTSKTIGMLVIRTLLSPQESLFLLLSRSRLLFFFFLNRPPKFDEHTIFLVQA